MGLPISEDRDDILWAR